ncbi:hypothetical protein MNB_SV-5-1493 [hydrothermal vent metagenome]|uniref:Uncharacterized protein n=1 Tax=hydrothermal vent metagenome TaxID=652676 RepID=A0A1W1EDQ2_9ZZZZ
MSHTDMKLIFKGRQYGLWGVDGGEDDRDNEEENERGF